MKSRILSLVTAAVLLTALLFVPQSMAMADDYALNEYEAAYLDLIDYDHAEALSKYLSNEIGNRFAYSPRRDMCVDWLMDEFTSYGYEPYIHEFTYGNPTINGLIEIGDKHYAYYGPTYGTTSVYKYDSRDVLPITGVEVVNWAAPGSALTVPTGAAYGGKAVFVTNGGTTAPSAANYYSAALALQNAGAGAVFFQTFREASNGNTTYSRIGNTTSGTSITIPVGYVLNYETRDMVSSLNAATELKVRLYGSNVGKNVVAVLPSATGSDKTVYFTTHHDTMQSGPGCNDNGSGTIFTLELARALRNVQFEYNIAFVAFDNEEGGLRGARAFCADMTNAERAGFVANYNVDMICTGQDNCIHMFLNISDPVLQSLDRNLGTTRLIEIPAALESAKKYDIFNHSYLAALKTGFDMSKFNICYDTTTDHYAFVQEATRAGNNYPNLTNAVEYDWRSNTAGTSFELLYHKAGDTFDLNFNRERLEKIGNMIALAVYYSARSLEEQVTAFLTTDAVSGIEGDVEYTLSLRGAKDLLVIELEFEIDGSLLAGKSIAGLNGFGSIEDVFWTYAGDDKWKASVTMTYPEAGSTTGFSTPGLTTVDIAKFIYTPRAQGDATMKLTKIRIVGLDGTTKYLDTTTIQGEATTTIEQLVWSKYDLNKDNKVDALDLGIMLLYVGFSADAVGWNDQVKVNDSRGRIVTASMCDVNGDGKIDMLDLLDLFIHYTK
ncbi:MAG: M28 family peptidase [Clostridiales bacterium]|nr:M28 family peptidase [Clostridiales bacterium]